jgi:pyridoxamine 5'-phosphate oxidase family protein
MDVFTPAELQYLATQPLMRFATASLTGRPDVAPVVYAVEGNTIVSGGFDITNTVRYRNIEANPRATLVIDDLASMDPWSPRGLKITGTAVIALDGGAPRFVITPEVIISWGINDTTPGIPAMERRVVA